jgi:hypothetical protein
MTRHMRSLGTFACLIIAAHAAACSKPEPPKKVVLDTAAESEDEDVTCAAGEKTRGQAFVVLELDSAAAQAGRLNISIAQQDSTLPVHARLQSSTGAAECDGNLSVVRFKVRGPQSYLGLSVRAGTKFLGVNARRSSNDPYQSGAMLNARAYATEDNAEELVWGDKLPGNMDNQRGRIRETYVEPDRTRRQPRGLP